MIRVKETFLDQFAVEICLDGILDDEAVPLVEDVCQNHMERKKRVVLNLGGLLYINRAGRNFLSGMKNRVSIVNQPDFMVLSQPASQGD